MKIDLASCLAQQESLTVTWHEKPAVADGEGFERLVAENHRCNFEIWHAEDDARRDDLGAEAVRQAKRKIDRLNQERHLCIEEIDTHLYAEWGPFASDLPAHSETPGMILDRLSIMALKAYHMEMEAQRESATEEHRRHCSALLSRIRHQRKDLSEALADLVREFEAGHRSFKHYRSFKMYNDPEMNPALYEVDRTD